MKSKNKKKRLTKDEIFAIAVAIFVIFTSLLNSWFSAGIAIGVLITIFIYKFNKE
jgi:hypothetical protein